MAEAANLLRHETSPYLLQHADNPVHWRPWGPAALEEARQTNRPILLSIGYAACHWCHVMAHESFEDPAIAALMNAHFVNIKVDREERPDVDQLYMSALHALGGRGGWPLTMFLTPDGGRFLAERISRPFRAGARRHSPGAVQRVGSLGEGDDPVKNDSAALLGVLTAMERANLGDQPGPAHLDTAATALLRQSTRTWRVGGRPEVPQSVDFPLPVAERVPHRADRAPGRAVTSCWSGCRRAASTIIWAAALPATSVDALWLVPHFEKMLYDNAQLLELLALAHAHRPSPLYVQRAAETVGWMTRDMTAATVDGRAAFAASEDADSEGEEGKFYVWTEAEVDRLLGGSAAAFKRAYDVTSGGNWEGHTILRRVTPPGTPDEEDTLARARQVLFEARALRVRPGRDDKVLADWNGLAIAALARASVVFGRPDWLTRAEQAQDFILAQMSAPDGRVQHAWRLGRVTAVGLLDDQAAMARASLALFAATGAPERLAQTIRFADAAQAAFADGEGGYCTTAADAPDVPLVRPRSAADTATPSGNGMLAEVLSLLWHLTGDQAWRGRAEALLRAFSGKPDQLVAMPSLLTAADLLEEAATVVIIGDPLHPLTQTLAATALSAADPAVAVLRAAGPDALPAGHPAFGKAAGPDGAAAFVCRRNVCGLPLADGPALGAALSAR